MQKGRRKFGTLIYLVQVELTADGADRWVWLAKCMTMMG